METNDSGAAFRNEHPIIMEIAAMLKLCHKEIQAMVELRWDEVGEKYEVCKDRVIGWATTKAEKTPTRGGAVPMDVDGVAAGGEEDCEELPE